MASGGWSNSWHRADLLDMRTYPRFQCTCPRLPLAVRHPRSSHISQSASLNARWCQCLQCPKTVWVVISVGTCSDVFEMSKRMDLLPLYNLDAPRKTAIFQSSVSTCFSFFPSSISFVFVVKGILYFDLSCVADV